MTKKTDAVTGWWRAISLRAKVTGVTVAVLAAGLLASGIGTVPFLRESLVGNMNTSLTSLAESTVTARLFDITADSERGIVFTPMENANPTEYFVAIYGPDGAFIDSAGGNGDSAPPQFPDTFPLQKTVAQETIPFELSGSPQAPAFRASVAAVYVTGTTDLYTQFVALPVAPIDKQIGNYLSIFSVLAVLIVIGGALLTRWLVTLTFRGLNQVESTAMSIASGDFSQRLTDIAPATEVGRLKLAINTMLGRVDAALSQRDSTVRQMRRFIGDASHELRTPLVTVRGYAELYRMGAIQGDEDTAQAMERIEKEAIRMGVLVEDLLALARLDERREVAFAAVDLRPVARDAALDVRAAAPLRPITVVDTTIPSESQAPAVRGQGEHTNPDTVSTATSAHAVDAQGRRRGANQASAAALAGATLSLLRRKPRPVPASEATTAAGAADAPVAPVEVPERFLGSDRTVEGPTEVPPIVFGDENRIRQVVANLLGNARRFTAEHSPIELEVGVDAQTGMASIAVIDHGEGIPEQIREQIFQRFWRADTSRTRETGGSGLGLAIVASIVETLHGTIVVDETPGGGATFRVSFPLAHDPDAAEHLSIATQPMSKIDLP